MRELQRGGRALLSRLKAERGCQQASNALLSLLRETHKMETLPNPSVFAINYTASTKMPKKIQPFRS